MLKTFGDLLRKLMELQYLTRMQKRVVATVSTRLHTNTFTRSSTCSLNTGALSGDWGILWIYKDSLNTEIFHDMSAQDSRQSAPLFTGVLTMPVQCYCKSSGEQRSTRFILLLAVRVEFSLSNCHLILEFQSFPQRSFFNFFGINLDCLILNINCLYVWKVEIGNGPITTQCKLLYSYIFTTTVYYVI